MEMLIPNMEAECLGRLIHTHAQRRTAKNLKYAEIQKIQLKKFFIIYNAIFSRKTTKQTHKRKNKQTTRHNKRNKQAQCFPVYRGSAKGRRDRINIHNMK